MHKSSCHDDSSLGGVHRSRLSIYTNKQVI
ncbi:hypothetical protein V6Z12_A05G182800 [Gossypium hirsutum]